MKFVPAPLHKLAPYDDEARAYLAHLSKSCVLEVEILLPRDMINHRRIFAQINELAQALHRDPEMLRAELLFHTGNCHVLGVHNHKTFVAIHHMDRRHMADHELHAFWDDALIYIKDELLPLIDDHEERERLRETLSLDGLASSRVI